MELFLLLLELQSKSLFNKMFLAFTNKSMTGFENRKWNYPNRKWNYFSYFLCFIQKTSFTECCQAQLQLQLQLSWKLSLALFSNSPTDKRRHFTDKRRHFTYKLWHFIPTEKVLQTHLIKKPLLQNVATLSSILDSQLS